MIDLSKRSSKKEILDRDDIPFEDIVQNMKELDSINRFLGGHAISIEGFKKIFQGSPVTVCEIGCGGGDNLRALSAWCDEKKIEAKFIGIDIKEECIRHAMNVNKNVNATWIISDYKDVKFDALPDIIFSSLFCHHFTNEEIAIMLRWMRSNSRAGFFTNDLHRHWAAYYSIKFITSVFSKSYLVKNDAPVSVERGFSKKDWVEIFELAGISNYKIKWKWAFRYLAWYKHAK